MLLKMSMNCTFVLEVCTIVCHLFPGIGWKLIFQSLIKSLIMSTKSYGIL